MTKKEAWQMMKHIVDSFYDVGEEKDFGFILMATNEDEFITAVNGEFKSLVEMVAQLCEDKYWREVFKEGLSL